MKLFHRFALPALLFAMAAPSVHSTPNSSLVTTWLGQRPQLIFWPGQRNNGTDHDEKTWEMIHQQNLERTDLLPAELGTGFGIGDCSLADAPGHLYRSPIQHVWVGTGSGGSSGSGGDGSGLVTVSPSSPVAGNLVTI